MFSDALFGARRLYEIEQRQRRAMIPILLDKVRGELANDDSCEIIVMMATMMRPLWTRHVEQYSASQREQNDEVLDAIDQPIHSGVYRCGFASI